MKIALIPARGGSKRIPHKNIRLFAGKPIIAYSIEAALQAGCFDAVVVSTDDPAIAEVAQQYGAEVPFMRPADIANDYATTTDVIRHALLWFHQQQQPVDALCCLYATAPFVRAEDLLAGYHLLAQDDTDYVFSATRYAFPIQRAIKLDAQQRVSMFQPEHLSTAHKTCLKHFMMQASFTGEPLMLFKWQTYLLPCCARHDFTPSASTGY